MVYCLLKTLPLTNLMWEVLLMNFLKRQFGDVSNKMDSDTSRKFEQEQHVIQGSAVVKDKAKAGMVGAFRGA